MRGLEGFGKVRGVKMDKVEKNGKGWFGVEFNGSHVSELMVTRDLEVFTEEGWKGEEITIIKEKK